MNNIGALEEQEKKVSVTDSQSISKEGDEVREEGKGRVM